MTPRGFDLHVHSVVSDGVYSPLQLLELARRSGLRGIAITDHDALPCPTAIAQSARQTQIPAWLAGVELSCELNGRGVHLLAYDFDVTNPQMVRVTEDLQQGRRDRLARIADALAPRTNGAMRKKLDCLSKHRCPGRRHLARALVELRLASSIRNAFDRYLQPLSAASGFDRPQLADAVRMIHSAGGLASIAHPPGNWDETVWTEIKAIGVDGIEMEFPAATGNRRRRLVDVVRRFGFLGTAGSDFHGDGAAEYLGRCMVEELPCHEHHNTHSEEHVA